MQDDDDDSDSSPSGGAESYLVYGSSLTAGSSKENPRVWENDYIIKRRLNSLIPPFDPRPGRMNLQQTVDLTVPPPGTPEAELRRDKDKTSTPHGTKIKLFIRSPSPPGNKSTSVEIPLKDCSSRVSPLRNELTIFNCVQNLNLLLPGSNNQNKLKKIWDQPYTIVYKEAEDELEKSMDVTAEHDTVQCEEKEEEVTAPPLFRGKNLREMLELLKRVYDISDNNGTKTADGLSKGDFVSKKISTKLLQQTEDSLSLICGSLPDWCHLLCLNCPFLFPHDVRLRYFSSTAFGTARSIAWLQNRTETQLGQLAHQHSGMTALVAAASAARRDDAHELLLGRLRHDRVTVPRDEEKLLDWAINVVTVHAARKSVLEVEFAGEEGTGLGPTLEFYALVAAELQRADLGLWLVDDVLVEDEQREVDIGEGVKPVGHYVQRSCGLFPAPLPQDCNKPSFKNVVSYFKFLGAFLAKCLQDGRLVDLPLSDAFLKIMCRGSKNFETEKLLLAKGDNTKAVTPSDDKKEFSLKPPKGPPSSYYRDSLSIADLKTLDPHRYEFLQSLIDVCDKRDAITSDKTLSVAQREAKVSSLQLTLSGVSCHVSDLGLTFQYLPSSKIYKYASQPLFEGGEEVLLTLRNARKYVKQTLDFCLDAGLRRQMDAFRDGFNEVFPMETLSVFTPAELRNLLCGDQHPQWNKDDVINFTEPKLGFTRDSAGFKKFVNVICSMSGDERKGFLQFATGCSSLPPGGLANLNPRLTIVRKVDATDTSYPSVNTCVHYLKLPDYSTEEIMRERLIVATKEKGFHLN